MPTSKDAAFLQFKRAVTSQAGFSLTKKVQYLFEAVIRVRPNTANNNITCNYLYPIQSQKLC